MFFFTLCDHCGSVTMTIEVGTNSATTLSRINVSGDTYDM